MIARLPRLNPRLNWRIIVPVVSGAMLAVGLGLLVCFVVALVIGDGEAAGAFGIPGLLVTVIAVTGMLSGTRLRSMPLRQRDGFFAVAVTWFSAAVVGAVPFLVHGTFDSPVDALFESMSGFTTTGASLLDDIEAEPHAVLLWRSLTQWLGGIGIVVLVIAIAPATGLATQRVFYAETSSLSSDRLTPRIADTAKILVGIYLTLTSIGFVAYVLAGMSGFDAINHTFTSIATGGFSTRTVSLAAFDSVAIEVVAIMLMAAGGVNFAFYWRALRGRDLWPQAAEVRLYVLILLGSIAVVTGSLAVSDGGGGLWEHLRGGAFSATTVLTGTGYTTDDFDGYNDFARSYLLLVMFVGGCAGSTAGGLKVIRVLLLAKTASQEVQRQLRPRAVQVLRTRGRVFSEELRRGVLGFFYIYIAVFIVGTLALAATGLDGFSALSGSAACLNLLGPAMGELGATDNYGAAPDAARVIFTLLMLAGRLEVFTILVLLTPAFWRPNVA